VLVLVLLLSLLWLLLWMLLWPGCRYYLPSQCRQPSCDHQYHPSVGAP